MAKHNNLIMVINYTADKPKGVEYISGFKMNSNSGLVPLFTHSPEKAQRFGPEGQVHVNWLSTSHVVDNTTFAFSLVKAPEKPTKLFDDGKDYSTVDIAIIVTSYETSQLYGQIKEKGLTYKQDMGGNLITIGNIGGADVCIAPVINVIDGVRVAYIDATSEVVDFSMVEAWVRAKCPQIDSITDNYRLLSEIASIKRSDPDKTAA